MESTFWMTAEETEREIERRSNLIVKYGKAGAARLSQHEITALPRKKHSHRCMACGSAVYCYKTRCTKPQRIELCAWCRPVGLPR